MYLKRIVDTDLENWRISKHRKPLMLRGARQVGKSSSVKNLAQQFENFIEINFDENPQFKAIFEQNSDVMNICELIQASTNIPIITGKY